MDNQEWSKVGEEIKNLVQTAVDSKDFRKLNETIDHTIQVTTNGVNKGLNRVEKAIHTAAANQTVLKKPQKAEPQNPWQGKNTYAVMGRPQTSLYKSTFGMTAGGTVLVVLGGILTLGLTIGSLVTGLVGFATGIVLGTQIALGVMLPLLFGSGCMLWIGGKMLGRVKRFKSYVSFLRQKSYCSIRELAESVRKSEKFIKKDLQDMIRRRMFLQGHLDRQETCLMVTHEAYEQYQAAQAQLEDRQRQADLLEEKNGVKNKELPEEAKKVIAEGSEFVRQIQACNDAIYGKEISEKITKMENIVNKIFARVAQQPELVSDLHKFMGYYLPTTVKLLQAYMEMDAQPVQGNNILASKKEIEGSLETINEAFENLLDSFFEDQAMDISSDITVLQTMLKQEGLTNSDFDTMI